MMSAFNANAMIFSLKSFIAAMLALYVALWLGFDNPYWALITVYVVAQPNAGAVLSKSVYRIAGTVTGGVMSVLLVPPLVNAPELLSITVALWLGLCVFLAALDKSVRSYMFVLAGYSTCIIVFPSVTHPEAIFTTAELRVQEITLGIVCSGLVHATLLPRSSGQLLLDRLDGAMRDAARWIADALSVSRPETLDHDRRRLAVAVNEMHDLVTHAGFEDPRHARQRHLYRALLVQIEQVLPLSAAVDDRILQLRQAETMPPEVDGLLVDVSAWVTAPSAGAGDRRAQADRLRERCGALEPAARPGMSWADALRLSLLARLADLIAVYANGLALGEAIRATPRDAEERRRIQGLLLTEGRAMHRDYYGALATGISTTITLFAACLLWMASGWEAGASAVTLTGVFFALYSGFGNPAVLLRNKFIGVVVRLNLGALYVLAILPAIDGFPMLAAALSPVLLVSGVLLTVPRYSPLAFNLVIGMFSSSIIATRFEPDFASYLNNGLGTLTGIYFALIMMQLLQPLWLQGAAQRLLKAGWTDIARGRHQAVSRWRSRMGHRLALLTVQAGAAGALTSAPTADALRDLRIGLSLVELEGLRRSLSDPARIAVTAVLDGAAAAYRVRVRQPELAPPAPLLGQIDHALETVLQGPVLQGAMAGVRRAATLALVGLRRDIFPLAPPPQPAPASRSPEPDRIRCDPAIRAPGARTLNVL